MKQKGSSQMGETKLKTLLHLVWLHPRNSLQRWTTPGVGQKLEVQASQRLEQLWTVAKTEAGGLAEQCKGLWVKRAALALYHGLRPHDRSFHPIFVWVWHERKRYSLALVNQKWCIRLRQMKRKKICVGGKTIAKQRIVKQWLLQWSAQLWQLFSCWNFPWVPTSER